MQINKFLNQSFCRTKSLIHSVTRESRAHLTPEINLKLITPDSPLWHQKVDVNEPHPLGEPFWAFYWPGGQVLTRFLLDSPGIVKGKRVLDVGSGCGAVAIAAAFSKAARVTANDIDLRAIAAIEINAELNHVPVCTNSENLIGTSCEEYDVILLGDMLYDSEFGSQIINWLKELRSNKKEIFIGDPGRDAVKSSIVRETLHCLAKYELDRITKQENSGFTSGFVYTVP